MGAGGADDAFLDPDYGQKLNILETNGGNYVSVLFHLGIHESKVKELLAFIARAEDKRIVVELTVYGNPTKTSPQAIAMGKQARKILKATCRFTNVIYRLNIQDEQATKEAMRGLNAGALIADKDFESPEAKQLKGEQHWVQLLSLLSKRNQSLPYHFTEIEAFNEQAAEGIAAFNRSVLAGAAAVRHRPRPQGDGFSGPALAGIRAIRTVEKHFNLWELEVAPYITPTADPYEAYALTDGRDGFLIYLPTAGSVHLQLDINPQIPMRVTVVGYLGTQKSELLQPPYENGFTLYTEEPRGGWMIIKPARL